MALDAANLIDRLGCELCLSWSWRPFPKTASETNMADASGSNAAAKKVAFITGGNRGLGYQTALDLGPLGVEIVIGSRDAAKGEQAAEKLRAAGVEAKSIKLDITQPLDYQAAYDYFDQHHGRLDILINNAGYAEGEFGSGAMPNVQTTTPQALREHFDVNFFGQVTLTQILLPLMRKAPAARIVNLSSILGSLALQADPKSPIYHAKAFAYDATKSALNAFTIHLAYELRDTKIKVNSAHPGWVKTDMGGPNATLELSEGGRTSVELALLDEDGPTGGFFHLGKPVPW